MLIVDRIDTTRLCDKLRCVVEFMRAGMSTSEIADTVRISPSGVRKRWMRAKKHGLPKIHDGLVPGDMAPGGTVRITDPRTSDYLPARLRHD